MSAFMHMPPGGPAPDILRYLLNTYRLVKVGTTQDQRRLFYNLRKEKAKLEREGFAPDTKLWRIEECLWM